MGANFRKHVQEAGLKIPTQPVLFMKPPTSLAGPGDIPIPKFVHEDRDEEMGPEQLDFETELAFVVSKDARDIKPEQAKDYILG
jgi:2-keto-4-pentenoate hydratase/2-oxohepta-3-ene-1,7-dioic acid hydratase in catechol pathway